MSGSFFRRCGCRDADGKQLGRKCPKLGAKGHGVWAFAVDLPPGPDGKRRQHRRGGFATKKEAEKAAEKITGRASNGQVVDDKETVGDWLKTWLSSKRNLRPTTAASYQGHIDNWLVPHLGHLALEKLRPADIHAAYLAMEAASPARGRRKVGPATVRRIHATLRAALSAAVKQQRLPYNPAQHVELPEAKRPKVQPWEATDLGKFLDQIGSDRLAPLYELAAMSGLRRGELCGLRWADCDLERRVITVRQQLVVVGHRITLGPPKTASGEHRKVDLDAGTVGVLLAHQLQQHIERGTWGGAYIDQDLVFAKENGEPLHPEYVTRHFQRLARKAGLRQVRLHDLRHGSASLQLAAGIPIAVVSKRLGHSSISITSDTYSHLLDGVGSAAAEAAAALVPRSSRFASVAPAALDHSVHTTCAQTPDGFLHVAADLDEPQVREAPLAGLEPATIGLEVRCSIR